MPILLVRHGPTAYNTTGASERIRGWLDLPLTAAGQQVAEDTAAQLARYPVTHVYSTDLQRGVATARALAALTGVPLTEHRQLRPWNLGVLQGQPVDQAMPIVQRYVHQPYQPVPEGESFVQFLLRYLPFVLPLVHQPALTAVVTHVRNVKMLEAHLAAGGYGFDLATWNRAPTVDPGGAVLVTPHSFQILSHPQRHPSSAAS